MKNAILLLLAMALVGGCASTKGSKAVSLAGDWNYSITGTPDGDFTGVMKVTQQDKAYKSVLGARGQEMPLEKFAYNPETKKVTGELYYSGTLVSLDATLEGDAMSGSMSAGGMDFPFKATRVKK